MNRKIKLLIGIICFVLFIILSIIAYNMLKGAVNPAQRLDIIEGKGNVSDKSNNPVNLQRKIAPDFTVEDISGNKVTLSQLFGKPIVLNFWASWCPPCKAEMPDFEKVYKELGEEITFVMLDMVDGQRETKETGEAHVKNNEFTFPVYYDTEQEAANTYAISSIPTTIFIDKEGYIVTGATGAIDEETIRKGIDMIKDKSKDENNTKATVVKISPDKAKKMMDEDSKIIILDVRTQVEFDEERIKGVILIPDNEIKSSAETLLPDKDKTILVYCKSGRRSAIAAGQLVEMGYTNVYDFGGIIDWPYYYTVSK